MGKIIRKSWIYFLLLSVFLISSLILFVHPLAGIADNGDFGRILFRFDLSPNALTSGDKFFNYFNREYVIWHTPTDTKYISSGNILVYTAIYLSRLFSSQIFDIRVLGLIHLTLYFIVLALLYYVITKIDETVAKISIIICLLFLTNIGYLVYFNSFYSEASSIIYFLLTVSYGIYLILKKKENRVTVLNFIIFDIFAFLFAISKSQNTILMVVILFFVIYLLIESKLKLYQNGIIFVITVVLTVGSFAVLKGNDKLEVVTKFDTVFFGVLKNSHQPEKDLLEFNLNSKYKDIIGYAYFAKNSRPYTENPEFKEEILKNVTYEKIVKFYLKRPKLIAHAFNTSAKNAFNLQVDYLGNYEKSKGYPPKAHVELWDFGTKIKMALGMNSSLGIIFMYLFFFSIILYEMKKGSNKDFVVLYTVISIISLVSFGMPILGEGENELAKHLFLFNYIFDFMLCSALAYIIYHAKKL